MKTYLYKKSMVFAILVLLVGAGVASSTIDMSSDECNFKLYGINFDSKDIFNQSKCSDSKGTSPPNIMIEDISGGFGLTVLIKNNGGIDLTDITLNVNVTGGYLVKLSKTYYEIPFLSVGESTEIHIDVFGIGLGVLTKFPEIMIIPRALHAHAEAQGIVARIIGPFITKIGNIINDPRAFDGYTLFTPEYHGNTYLINNSGEIVHAWESNYIQGLAVYLLENGNLVRSEIPYANPIFMGGGISGRVEMFDWNGTVVWEFEYSNNQHCMHHDIEVLPNGNILMIAWEYKTAEEAIIAGRNPASLHTEELWSDHIIEVEPTGTNGGNIVWEWHVWDHIIQDFDSTKENYGAIADHPELIDLNFGGRQVDWNHINSVDYNEEFDQILLSSHNQNEIWIIDHSTTTEEAAGHTGGKCGTGGDLLYRWGNPQAYRAGSPKDQKFFGQHDAQWIESGCPGEGNILVFNNGHRSPDGQFSSVDEIIPPVDGNGNYHKMSESAFGPKKQVWIYTAEPLTDFYSGHISGAQRLPNGNTLICSGADGIFFEVTWNKEIVWEYVNQIPDLFDNHVFKIRRYAPDYPGLSNLFD